VRKEILRHNSKIVLQFRNFVNKVWPKCKEHYFQITVYVNIACVNIILLFARLLHI
jgi:hypothetical protein